MYSTYIVTTSGEQVESEQHARRADAYGRFEELCAMLADQSNEAAVIAADDGREYAIRAEGDGFTGRGDVELIRPPVEPIDVH